MKTTVSLFAAVIATLVLSSCSAGRTTVRTYPANGSAPTVTHYSRAYISDVVAMPGGLDIRVTGANAKKVNPITYPVARAVGALGPEDTNVPVSFVVHFRNSSDASKTLTLESIEMNGALAPLTPCELRLEPGAKAATEPVSGMYSSWDTSTTTQLVVRVMLRVDGSEHAPRIALDRETVDELNRRLR